MKIIKLNFIDQKESEATYAKKIKKKESKINWNEKLQKIIAKINALHPNPGCWFKLLMDQELKLFKAKEIKKSGKAGTILDDKMTIACLKNAIKILELKKEGKKQMILNEYLKGYKIKIGQKIN